MIRDVEHDGLILRVHDAGPTDGEVVVLIIEPSDEHDLRAILDTADPVAGTIAWR